MLACLSGFIRPPTPTLVNKFQAIFRVVSCLKAISDSCRGQFVLSLGTKVSESLLQNPSVYSFDSSPSFFFFFFSDLASGLMTVYRPRSLSLMRYCLVRRKRSAALKYLLDFMISMMLVSLSMHYRAISNPLSCLSALQPLQKQIQLGSKSLKYSFGLQNRLGLMKSDSLKVSLMWREFCSGCSSLYRRLTMQLSNMLQFHTPTRKALKEKSRLCIPPMSDKKSTKWYRVRLYCIVSRCISIVRSNQAWQSFSQDLSGILLKSNKLPSSTEVRESRSIKPSCRSTDCYCSLQTVLV